MALCPPAKFRAAEAPPRLVLERGERRALAARLTRSSQALSLRFSVAAIWSSSGSDRALPQFAVPPPLVVPPAGAMKWIMSVSYGWYAGKNKIGKRSFVV